MPVCGYFPRRGPGLRMPKSTGEADGLGIRYRGQVVNDNVGVDEAFVREKQAVQLHVVQTGLWTGVSPQGIRFSPLLPHQDGEPTLLTRRTSV